MYSSLEELCCEAEEKNCALWELVLQDDMQQRGVSRLCCHKGTVSYHEKGR